MKRSWKLVLLLSLAILLTMMPAVVGLEGGDEGPEGEGGGDEGPEGEGGENEGPEGERDDKEEDKNDEDREREEREEREREEREGNHCEPPNEHLLCNPTLLPTAVPSYSPTTPAPTFVYTIDFSDTRETMIYPEDGTEDDMFGAHTSIYHTTAVIGAYGARDNNEQKEHSGAVYIYETNATSYPYYDDGSTPWTFTQKLYLEKWETKCNPEGEDCETKLDEKYSEDAEFGYAHDVFNNTLVVGAHKHMEAKEEGGGAFVFTRSVSTGQWSQTATLMPEEEDMHDYKYFGNSISMYQSTVVVGAVGDNDKGAASGAIYVFDYDSRYEYWAMSVKLTSEDAGQHDNFGFSSGIDRSVIVAGATGDDTMGKNCGAAYVFYKFYGKWQEQAKIVPYDCQDDGNYFFFGNAVSVYDKTAAVGAYAAHGHWDSAGAVYLYYMTSNGWLLQKKIIAHDGMSGDKFGWDVALYKDTVVVGAWGESGKEEQNEDEQREREEREREEREREPGHRRLQPDKEHEGENCGPNSPPDCQQYRGFYSYRGASAGAAYVFARSGTSWVQEFKLLPETSAEYDAFGSAVDIHENVLFIGAYQADGAYDNTGAAYIYAPPTMSPPSSSSSSTVFVVTGEAKLDALLAVCLILVPACIAGVWYYTNMKKNETPSRDAHMPLSSDSQHGSVAPWSMHGAFDDSSRGSTSRGVPTRSPLRGPPVAR